VAHTSKTAALVVAAAVTLSPVSPRLDNLCRNPAFRNMHEHECIINAGGGVDGEGGRRGLFDIIGDIIGGLPGL
jgi:hypothetical protein